MSNEIQKDFSITPIDGGEIVRTEYGMYKVENTYKGYTNILQDRKIVYIAGKGICLGNFPSKETAYRGISLYEKMKFGNNSGRYIRISSNGCPDDPRRVNRIISKSDDGIVYFHNDVYDIMILDKISVSKDPESASCKIAYLMSNGYEPIVFVSSEKIINCSPDSINWVITK